ncbi:transglutaminase-like cysteine peptidase [Geovibrio ferrireducens]|uniref:transglutaminase-like cysteine peptidase n=1 Tax=Geovibrio ferrireducens TaxID=46201 RepID=UPI0022475EB2|nr:transglutaminase-like cysteine peptidase [Geovibrio ferrireducens]
MINFKRIMLIVSAAVTVYVAAAVSSEMFYVPEDVRSTFKSRYGDQADKRLAGLLSLMNEIASADEETKIIEVNKFFNQVEYRSDALVWGKSDYWASRLEFIGKGMGDCEDYAVAKFLTLIQLGVPQEKLFLTYVKAIGYAEVAHMVVSYYPQKGAVPLVLDNYNKQILPATKRNDLVPVYSFTANDLYIQKQQGLGKRVNPSSSKNLQKLKEIDLEIYKR